MHRIPGQNGFDLHLVHIGRNVVNYFDFRFRQAAPYKMEVKDIQIIEESRVGLFVRAPKHASVSSINAITV